jgi:type II secretory pathway pseudopilin PulG
MLFCAQKRSGMSLLELTLVAGIMSIVSLFLGQMFFNQSKAAKSLELKAVARDLADDILATLGNQANCVASLAGLQANGPTQIAQIKSDADGILGGPSVLRYKASDSYGTPPIQLESMTLGTDPAQGAPALSADQTGTILLTLKFNLGASVIGGSQLVVQRRLRATTSASPPTPVTIATCSANEVSNLGPIFQTVCLPGAPGHQYSSCCRITHSNGVVECRVKTGWGVSHTWNKTTSTYPFTQNPLPAGHYTLEWHLWTGGQEMPWLCRTNSQNGSVDCSYVNGGWTWPWTWTQSLEQPWP